MTRENVAEIRGKSAETSDETPFHEGSDDEEKYRNGNEDHYRDLRFHSETGSDDRDCGYYGDYPEGD